MDINDIPFQRKSSLMGRRDFLISSIVLSAGVGSGLSKTGDEPHLIRNAALEALHFQNSTNAFIWRNWYLVPVDRLAKVLNTDVDKVIYHANLMGLPQAPDISSEQFARSYITIIRRNWHILPEEQLLLLLDWSKEKLTYILQEDDFLSIKLGPKPICRPVEFKHEAKAGVEWIAKTIDREFPDGLQATGEPLFYFVKKLSVPSTENGSSISAPGFAPRFGYSFFTLFGDPLLEPEIDPFPEGYLERMASSGMDSTWLHIVLNKLSPFPWDPTLSANWELRLTNLEKLVKKCKSQGIGIYLYLNEPRYLPLSFFEKYPEYKGAARDGKAALCTSHPDVQKYLVDSIATIVARVPDLAGFFSITASENPSHCWSHGQGEDCLRCRTRGPEEVIAELNNLYQTGIEKGIAAHLKKDGNRSSESLPKLIVYDWAWKPGWAGKIIPGLPSGSALMSVSEWGLEIERGGIKSKVGEYSISSIGPSDQALSRWKTAKMNGLKTIAKIQAGNSWEIAAVPYIPAVENVARHVWNLKQAGVDGLMLGWTLGGYPSPNMEVIAEIGKDSSLSPLTAMERVAARRFGKASAAVVAAWVGFSRAFSEFPYNIGVVYRAPLQTGPANLLWNQPTGYTSTMVGIAYDDLNAWRGVYPKETFIEQLYKVAQGFEESLRLMLKQTGTLSLTNNETRLLEEECRIAETVSIHYRSVANQSSFIVLRDLLAGEVKKDRRLIAIGKIRELLNNEIALAKRMYELQSIDSRLGFEASNHYFYIPADLTEKVLNCRYLLDFWLPELS